MISSHPNVIAPLGDGAFYGPKIDITVYDALRRVRDGGTRESLDIMGTLKGEMYISITNAHFDNLRPLDPFHMNLNQFALRRKFQCATVQLDFQLPIRFGLEYQTEV